MITERFDVIREAAQIPRQIPTLVAMDLFTAAKLEMESVRHLFSADVNVFRRQLLMHWFMKMEKAGWQPTFPAISDCVHRREP